jgi:membrane protease YdiL (CAAX protease family)
MAKFYNRPAFKIPELIIVYIGLPLLYYFNLIPFHKSIPLLLVFFVCLFFLLRDKSFDRNQFGFNGFRNWRPIVLRFLVFAVVTSILIWIFARPKFFVMPARNPMLWGMIMIFYPLWSAFPQELIYRTWFFKRYRDLFKRQWFFFLTNALLFSFSHIIFRNWLALALTFAGGFIFAITYNRSRSLMTVFVEHSIYGDFIFTVGIGQFFYMALSSH